MDNPSDKQIRRSRFNIFLYDFYEARDFANYILNRDLHKFQDPQSTTRLIHLAFNTSLVVSYCRPFHKRNDQNRQPRVSIGKTRVTNVLDVYEQTLHNEITSKRDQAFAHSDSVAHEFKDGDYSGRSDVLQTCA